MVVIAKDPAQCGEKARDPTFEISSGAVRLGYTLSAARGAALDCTATTILTLNNLPSGELQVAADARSETVMAVRTPAQGVAIPTKFLGVQAIQEAQFHERRIYQQRNGDAMTIIVKDPAQCGQRPVDPSVVVKGGEVEVGFSLPQDTSEDGRDCVATAIFTVQNLPDRNLQVAVNEQIKPLEITAGSDGESAASMTFKGVPAVPTSGFHGQVVLQHRERDRLVVIVKDGANCGERPEGASFRLNGRSLQLNYGLPSIKAASYGESPCAATAIFTLKNLPPVDLRVAGIVIREGVPVSLKD